MIHCASCGKAIPKDSRFCTFCGATVPVVDPETPNVAKPSTATPPNISSSRPGPNYVSSGEAEYNTTLVTRTERLPFYRNPGFYGGLMVLIGFFLPWFNVTPPFSGYDLLNNYINDTLSGSAIFIIILLILPPFGGLVVFIQSITGGIRGLSGFFKWLAFLSVVFYLTLLGIGMDDTSTSVLGIDPNSTRSILSTIGVGLWLTMVGVVVMLFNRRVRRTI